MAWLLSIVMVLTMLPWGAFSPSKAWAEEEAVIPLEEPSPQPQQEVPPAEEPAAVEAEQPQPPTAPPVEQPVQTITEKSAEAATEASAEAATVAPVEAATEEPVAVATEVLEATPTQAPVEQETTPPTQAPMTQPPTDSQLTPEAQQPAEEHSVLTGYVKVTANSLLLRRSGLGQATVRRGTILLADGSSDGDLVKVYFRTEELGSGNAFVTAKHLVALSEGESKAVRTQNAGAAIQSGTGLPIPMVSITQVQETETPEPVIDEAPSQPAETADPESIPALDADTQPEEASPAEDASLSDMEPEVSDADQLDQVDASPTFDDSPEPADDSASEVSGEAAEGEEPDASMPPDAISDSDVISEPEQGQDAVAVATWDDSISIDITGNVSDQGQGELTVAFHKAAGSSTLEQASLVIALSTQAQLLELTAQDIGGVQPSIHPEGEAYILRYALGEVPPQTSFAPVIRFRVEAALPQDTTDELAEESQQSFSLSVHAGVYALIQQEEGLPEEQAPAASLHSLIMQMLVPQALASQEGAAASSHEDGAEPALVAEGESTFTFVLTGEPSRAPGDVSVADFTVKLVEPKAYTGNRQTIRVDINITNASYDLSGTVIKVSVPKLHLDDNIASNWGLEGGPVNGATYQVVDEGDNRVLIYTFSSLPVSYLYFYAYLKTKPYETPNQFAVPVTATMLTPQGDSFQDSSHLEVVHHVVPPRITTYPINGIQDEGTLFFGGMADPANPDYIAQDAAQALFSQFYYIAEQTGIGGNAGSRAYEKRVITVTLPSYTGPDGNLHYAQVDLSKTPGWVVSADGKTATYTDTTRQADYINTANLDPNKLALKMPGARADSTTPYTQDIAVTYYPENATAYELENLVTTTAKQTFYLTSALPKPGMYKAVSPTTLMDQMYAKQNPSTWTVKVTNTDPNLYMQSVVLKDDQLDNHYGFLSVAAYSTEGALVLGDQPGRVSIIAQTEQGDVVIADNLLLTQSPSAYFSVPQGTTGIRLVTLDSALLKPGGSLTMSIKTLLKDPVNTTYVPTVVSKFRNIAVGSGMYTDGTQSLGSNQASVTTDQLFRPYKPAMYIAKTQSQSQALADVPMTYTLRLYSTTGTILLQPDQLRAPVVLDLLPKGMVFDTGRTPSVKNDTNVSANNNVFAAMPEVIENYQDSGRTALLWRGKQAIEANSGTGTLYYTFTVPVRTTIMMDEGVNTNEAYFAWHNNQPTVPSSTQQVGVYSNAVTDSFGIGGGGPIASRKIDMTFNPPGQVIPRKLAKGSLNSNPVSYGNTEVGKPASYLLTLKNANDTFAYTGIQAMDILPRQGVAGSQFSAFLSQAPSYPAEYDVDYATGTPEATLVYMQNNANWGAMPADAATVTAIRFTMKGEASIAPQQLHSFTVPVLVPDDAALNGGMKATNRMYTILPGLTEPMYSSAVLEIYAYQVVGKAFLDYNRDGLYQTGEQLLPGIVVKLLDQSGSPVLDASGTPIQTITDSSGNYKLSSMVSGTYKVAFEYGGALTPTIVPADSSTNMQANHATGTGGTSLTEAFTTVFKPGVTTIRNAGFYQDAFDISARKVWASLPTPNAGTPAVSLQLRRSLPGGEVTDVGAPRELSSDNQVVWADQPAYENGQPYTYTVVEVDIPDGYKVAYTGNAVSGFTVTNTYDGKSADGQPEASPYTISVSKVWSGYGNAPTPTSATFRLRRNDGFTTTTQSANSGNGWKASFSNLLRYDTLGQPFIYETVETAIPTGCTVSYGGNMNDGFVVTNTYAGRITIEKQLYDSNGNKIVSPVRQFEVLLTRPDGTQETITVDNANSTILSPLTPGQYSIQEKPYPNYTTTYSPEGGTVSLTATNAQARVTITNKELDNGQLTITKKLLAADGETELTDARNFDIKVAGPLGTRVETLTSGSPLVLTGLKYGTYTVTEIIDENYTTTVTGPVTLSAQQATGAVTVTNQEKALGSLTITKLVAGTTAQAALEKPFSVTVSGPYNYTNTFNIQHLGKSSLSGLPYGTYTITETLPNGYTMASSPAGNQVTLSIDSKAGTFDITNSYDGTTNNENPEQPVTQEVTVTAKKTWENIPAGTTSFPKATLTLYQSGAAHGTAIELTATGNDEQEAKWGNLLKYAPDGSEFVYTVKETALSNGYARTVSADGLTITNSYDGTTNNQNPELPVTQDAAVTAKKTWDKIPAGTTSFPKATLTLYQSGKAHGTAIELTATGDGEQEAKWNNLPKYAPDGSEFVYTVKETALSNGYKQTVSDDGLTITNRYDGTTNNENPEEPVTQEVTVTATKKWANIPAGTTSFPKATLTLYQSGKAHGIAIELTATGNSEQEAEWNNLPKYAPDGSEFVYTVKETALSNGYARTVSADGLTITNRYDGTTNNQNPEQPVTQDAAVTAKKTWENIPAGTTSFPKATLTLYQGGVAHRTAIELIATGNGEQEAKWENLPKYAPDGSEFVYTVKETALSNGYAQTVSADGLTITNRYDGTTNNENPQQPVAQEAAVTAKKIWANIPAGTTSFPKASFALFLAGEQHGDPIQLQSTGNGEQEAKWENLLKYAPDGSDIAYTVKEIQLSNGYRMTPNGTTITNTYDGISTNNPDPSNPTDPSSPETPTTAYAALRAKKVWVNIPNGTTSFPKASIGLLQSGSAYGKAIALKATGNGEQPISWEKLPKYAPDGSEFVYTIKETMLPNGYASKISQDGLTITNTYDGKTDNSNPDKPVSAPVSIKATKVWKGLPAGLKVPEISFQLTRNGQALGQPATLPPGTTQVTWDGLLRFAPDGQPFTYMVTEPQVPVGYTMTRKDFEITNSYALQTPSLIVNLGEGLNNNLGDCID